MLYLNWCLALVFCGSASRRMVVAMWAVTLTLQPAHSGVDGIGDGVVCRDLVRLIGMCQAGT